MAEKQTLKLEVVTPKGAALSADVDWVQAPSVAGEFGVLPEHLPLLAALKPGVLRYAQGATQKFAAVDVGFVEAGPQRVTVLTEGFVPASEVNRDAAKRRAEELDAQLKAFTGSRDERAFQELERAYAWETAKLDAAATS